MFLFLLTHLEVSSVHVFQMLPRESQARADMSGINSYVEWIISQMDDCVIVSRTESYSYVTLNVALDRGGGGSA